MTDSNVTPVWLCECNSFACRERITLSDEVYEKARDKGYVVLPDHVEPGEEIIEKNNDHWIVKA